jgi:hypothetical protein
MNPVLTYIMPFNPIFILSFHLCLGFSLWSLLSRHLCLFHLAVIVQLFTKFHPFYATDDSLPNLQVLTLFGSIWNWSTQVYHMSARSILILSPRISVFLVNTLPQSFPLGICVHFLSVSPDLWSQIAELSALFYLKHISAHINVFSLVLFMIAFLLLCCAVYINLNSPESHPASIFLFTTLRMYRTSTHRYFCPSQESDILPHVRVCFFREAMQHWTKPDTK